MQSKSSSRSAVGRIPIGTFCMGALLGAGVPSVASAQLGTPLTSPRLVNINGATDSGTDDLISIATGTGPRTLAVFSSNEPSLGGGGDRDIYVTRTRDDGQSWATPTLLTSTFLTDGSAVDDEPYVTFAGSTYMVAWASNRLGTAGARGIFTAFAGNQGVSFLNAFPVNSAFATDAVDESRPCVAGSGNVFVLVWQRDDSAGEEDLWFSRLDSNVANTWSVPARLNSNGATDTGRDVAPRLATDGSGTWVAVWGSQENLGGTIGTDRDILFVRSTDNGITWSAPAPLNTNAATDGGVSDSLPAITVDRATGTWLTAWSSNNSLGGTLGADFEIFVSRSTNGGVTWSPMSVVNTDAAVDPANTTDSSPEIEADQLGHVVVTWHRSVAAVTDLDVFGARSDDLGLTWTPPQAVNTNAATDAGNDFNARVASDGFGHWIVAWNSTDDLGGTIGTDADLLATHFQLPQATVTTRFCYGTAETGNAPRCPCGNDSAEALQEGCRNSTGVGASVSMFTPTSLATSTHTMSAAGMPVGSPTLFFQGTNQVNQGYGSVFGDGLRCVGGTVVRLGIGTTTVAHNASISFFTIGLVPGDVRFYQAWYRDTGATCGNGFFNLSSAQTCVWVP